MSWPGGPQSGADGSRPGPTTGDLLALALALAGGAASVTLMFLAMRAVMGVGGSCAEGGPYAIATHCPNGAAAGMVLGIFALLGSLGLAARFGPRVGGVWASAPVFGWTGLFVALGWNFLEAGFSAEGGFDVVGLLLGAMFWAMGIVPLAVVAFGGAAGAAWLSGGASAPSVRRPTKPPSLGVSGVSDASDALSGDPGRASADAAQTQELIAQLERLADLRARGLLEEDEYRAMKATIVRALGRTE